MSRLVFNKTRLDITGKELEQYQARMKPMSELEAYVRKDILSMKLVAEEEEGEISLIEIFGDVEYCISLYLNEKGYIYFGDRECFLEYSSRRKKYVFGGYGFDGKLYEIKGFLEIKEH